MRASRSPRVIEERAKAALRVADPPAMEARPADPEGERRLDPFFPGNPDAAGAETKPLEIRGFGAPRWTAAAGGEEEKPRSLLIGVAKETTVRIGAAALLLNVHTPDATGA